MHLSKKKKKKQNQICILSGGKVQKERFGLQSSVSFAFGQRMSSTGHVMQAIMVIVLWLLIFTGLRVQGDEKSTAAPAATTASGAEGGGGNVTAAVSAPKNASAEGDEEIKNDEKSGNETKEESQVGTTAGSQDETTEESKDESTEESKDEGAEESKDESEEGMTEGEGEEGEVTATPAPEEPEAGEAAAPGAPAAPAPPAAPAGTTESPVDAEESGESGATPTPLHLPQKSNVMLSGTYHRFHLSLSTLAPSFLQNSEQLCILPSEEILIIFGYILW